MTGRHPKLLFTILLLFWSVSSATGEPPANSLAPLTPIDPPNAVVAELGKTLFFDTRLSGDATISCASCHQPELAFTDGLPLSKGYPGTLYFRNTPTLINVSRLSTFYWDGRMSGDDLPSLVRDHIAEAHFLQADGRLVIERMRQVPEYEQRFRAVMGGEPSYGRILNAIAAFVTSLQSSNVPMDEFLRGDQAAMSESAQRGMQLFVGKADCIRCHHGPMLSDGSFHNLGVPVNPDVFANPERHITFRRFMRTLGVGRCDSLRRDIGHGCVTKEQQDDFTFRTPSLREVAKTAPYMHNGVFETLESVVDFYDQGGGQRSDLSPLHLDAQQKRDLVEFLKAMSGEPISVKKVEPPAYQVRTLGES